MSELIKVRKSTLADTDADLKVPSNDSQLDATTTEVKTLIQKFQTQTSGPSNSRVKLYKENDEEPGKPQVPESTQLSHPAEIIIKAA